MHASICLYWLSNSSNTCEDSTESDDKENVEDGRSYDGSCSYISFCNKNSCKQEETEKKVDECKETRGSVIELSWRLSHLHPKKEGKQSIDDLSRLSLWLTLAEKEQDVWL